MDIYDPARSRGPIPEHLAIWSWYAPHQAWLRDSGALYHDPGAASAARADLACAYLAGERGRALEKERGTQRAATLIYRASRPGRPAPHWFTTTERALADLRRCAAADPTK